MSSINKVMLVGRVGKDPEVRDLNNGKIVANFSMATSEDYKNKDGEKLSNTEWHNVVFFGRAAEIARDYVIKGMLVGIEGKIKTEKYQAKDGSDRYTTKIYGDVLKMLGSKGEKKEVSEKSSDPENSFNDDIPF